jgi:hypothetical protein
MHILLVIQIFIMLIILLGCTREETPPVLIGELEPIFPLEEFRFADFMLFDFRMVNNGEVITGDFLFANAIRSAAFPDTRRFIELGFSGVHDEFRMVRNEAEALLLPDNIITAWPSESTVRLVEFFNLLVHQPACDYTEEGLTGDIDLNQFSLSYPVTIDDLFENRGKIEELYHAMNHTVINRISFAAAMDRPFPWENELGYQ